MVEAEYRPQIETAGAEAGYRPMSRLEALSEINKNVILTTKLAAPEKARLTGWAIAPSVPGLSEGLAVLYSPNVSREKVFDPPREHELREGSEKATDSRYAIDGFRFRTEKGVECILYYSGLPAGGETTLPPHIHSKSYEHYFKQSGESYLGNVLMRDYEVVPPNTPHHLVAGENGAAFWILLENVDGIDDDKIHEPMEVGRG